MDGKINLETADGRVVFSPVNT